MAHDWKDSGGSQFFVTHSPQPHLDARYTVFGSVSSGLDVVDRLEARGLVERAPDPADRRAMTVSLTAVGTEVLALLAETRPWELAERLGERLMARLRAAALCFADPTPF